MEKEDVYKILHSANYNKLLAYLGGGLVSFFTLFQITTEINQLDKSIAVLISLTTFIGVLIFTIASFSNYDEIIYLENKLGLSKEMVGKLKPSGWFSQAINGEGSNRKISWRLWGAGLGFAFISLFMFIFVLCKKQVSISNVCDVFKWIGGLS